MTDSQLTISLDQLTDDQRAALARECPGDALTDAVVKHLRFRADLRLEQEAYERAEAAGRLYMARYWCYYQIREGRFLTAEEAFRALSVHRENDTAAPEGVFAPDGSRVPWPEWW